MRRSSLTPRKSRRATASSPQVQAAAREVVGRRAPTSAKSSWVMALNREDLPEPVPPKKATTVWSTPRARRLATSSIPVWAGMARLAGTSVGQASSACLMRARRS